MKHSVSCCCFLNSVCFVLFFPWTLLWNNSWTYHPHLLDIFKEIYQDNSERQMKPASQETVFDLTFLHKKNSRVQFLGAECGVSGLIPLLNYALSQIFERVYFARAGNMLPYSEKLSCSCLISHFPLPFQNPKTSGNTIFSSLSMWNIL